jgi:hypothetical protein
LFGQFDPASHAGKQDEGGEAVHVDGMLDFPGRVLGIAASPPRSSMSLRTASLS